MNYLFFTFASLGFTNALFLHWQYRRFKKTGQKMYCLLKEDCTAVIGSIYGTTFGIKNEIIGIVFYLSLMAYSLFGGPLPIIKAALFLAVLFSLYLLFLQFFVIKRFCSWCLIAIAINFTIFFLLTQYS